MARSKADKPIDAGVLMGSRPGTETPFSAQEYVLDGERWVIEMDWRELHGRGEPVVVTIRSAANDVPVRADLIRRLPFGKLQEAVRRSAQSTLALLATKKAPSPLFQTVVDTMATTWTPVAEPGPRRGRKLTLAELEEIAEVYRDAWRDGRAVTDAVSTAGNVGKSAAGKRIMLARAAGLLTDIPEPRRMEGRT
jgi:hypothetical protein